MPELVGGLGGGKVGREEGMGWEGGREGGVDIFD